MSWFSDLSSKLTEQVMSASAQLQEQATEKAKQYMQQQE